MEKNYPVQKYANGPPPPNRAVQAVSLNYLSPNQSKIVFFLCGANDSFKTDCFNEFLLDFECLMIYDS